MIRKLVSGLLLMASDNPVNTGVAIATALIILWIIKSIFMSTKNHVFGGLLLVLMASISVFIIGSVITTGSATVSACERSVKEVSSLMRKPPKETGARTMADQALDYDNVVKSVYDGSFGEQTVVVLQNMY